MSAEALSAELEKLLKLHQSLLELAGKKTDIIKNGDMEALNQLLKEEQNHIAAIEQVERERQKLAKAIAPTMVQPKVSDCLQYVSELEQEKLLEGTDKLKHVMNALKEQNYLNQQLLHQSLQFVNVSMNLIMPQPKNINYGPPAKHNQSTEKMSQSLFNSKA